jgi:hypothetical protein
VTDVSAIVYVLFAVLFVGIQILLASVDDESPRGRAAADREQHDQEVPRARSQPDEQPAATSSAHPTIGDPPRIAE